MTNKITVDFKNSFYRKTRGNSSIIRKNLKRTGRDLMLRTFDKARELAPHNKGYVRRSIHMKEVKTSDNSFTYEIYTTNPTAGGTNRWSTSGKYGADFNLIRWMESTGGVFRSDNPAGRAGKQHIPERKARFMKYAKEWAVDEVKKITGSKGSKIKYGLVT